MSATIAVSPTTDSFRLPTDFMVSRGGTEPNRSSTPASPLRALILRGEGSSPGIEDAGRLNAPRPSPTIEVMPTAAAASHVLMDDKGRPWIDATNVKVIELAAEHLAYGWSADDLHENHPHLSLAQIYAALAWYYDHQPEMDVEIERQEARVRELKAAAVPSSLAARVLRKRR